MLYQTCLIYFLLWNIIEDILRDVSVFFTASMVKSTVIKMVWLPTSFKKCQISILQKKYRGLEHHESE